MEEKVCKICGKKWIKNECIPNFLPQYIKEKIEYIPQCNCSNSAFKKSLEEEAKKNDMMNLKAYSNKFKNVSIVDEKFRNSLFEKAQMNDKHMIIAKNYCDNFLKNKVKKGLLFSGTVGVGKTYAASCIANFLMQKNKKVLVMNLALYLMTIKKDWGKFENDYLKYVEDAELVIIDDFGIENITSFVNEKLFLIIDTRYRSLKPLIITSNLTLEEIYETFGARVGDRISEMCIEIVCVGESKRK